MIRLILRGRTGNILFQYALGRALAAKHGVPLVLDASWYNRQGWSEVSHFLKLPLQAKVLRPFPLASLASRALRHYWGKHYWELLGVPALREPTDDQSFNPGIANAPADCMLSGFFQSPLYFESIAVELRSELKTLFENWSRTNRDSSRQSMFSSPGTVAVHVRRGDYLHHTAFAVCDLPYYRTAMERMRASLKDARFFILVLPQNLF